MGELPSAPILGTLEADPSVPPTWEQGRSTHPRTDGYVGSFANRGPRLACRCDSWRPCWGRRTRTSPRSSTARDALIRLSSSPGASPAEAIPKSAWEGSFDVGSGRDLLLHRKRSTSPHRASASRFVGFAVSQAADDDGLRRDCCAECRGDSLHAPMPPHWRRSSFISSSGTRSCRRFCRAVGATKPRGGSLVHFGSPCEEIVAVSVRAYLV